jgi:hypothetical protein
MNPRQACSLFVLALFGLSTSVAGAEKAEVSVRTHGHRFHHVAFDTSGCTVKYRLFFDAPAEAYANPAKAHFQFKARLRMQSGKSVVSLIFGNHGGGERVYERDYDTSSEGCWAKEPQKLAGVDVEACRGRGCTPAAFSE